MANNNALLAITAAAVETRLNHTAPAQPWAAEFQAVKSWADWDEALKEADALHVDIVPVGLRDSQLDDRDSMRHTVDIDVGARRRFAPHEFDSDGRLPWPAAAELTLLVEQIQEHLAAARLDETPGVIWEGVDVRASFVRSHLRELRQFTGIVRVSFQAVKQLGAAAT